MHSWSYFASRVRSLFALLMYLGGYTSCAVSNLFTAARHKSLWKVQTTCQKFTRLVMTSPDPKKLAKTVKIGTHGGKFHCDEVLAAYFLKLLPQYKHAEIIRTRDQAILDTCDIVVDVGGEYDPEKHRYDHHQRGFNESMNSILKNKRWTTKLSSAGLVYCHFGKDILKALLPEKNDEKLLDALYDKMYEVFVEEIDAIDNGIPMFDGEPKYHINSNLSSRVGHLNPAWNAPQEDEGSLRIFTKAMDLVGREFEDRLQYYTESWWPARSLALEAIESRFEFHKSGEVILLSTMFPWKDHFFDIIEELNIPNGTIKFVVFLNTSSGTWYVQAVPVNIASFVCCRFLLEPWRGLRNEELSELTGIEGCIFAHATGFIGGNKTKEGALQMAVKSIEAGKQPDDGIPE